MVTGLAVVAIAGSVMSASAQRKAGKANRRLAEGNAAIGRQRALDAEKRGDEEVQLSNKRFESLRSNNKVGFASQNVAIDSGNASEINRDISIKARDESKMILNNAAIEAWGFRSGAAQQVAQGRAAERAGRNAAIGTLLSGAAGAISIARTP